MDENERLTWGRSLPGELTERWPKDEKGEFEAPALLASCTQLDMRDTMLMGMLEAYGIPCFKRYPHYGGFGKTMLGMSAEGVDVMVPESLLEDARALMEGEPEDEEL